MEPAATTYPVRAAVPWVREEDRVVVLLPKRLGPLSRLLRQATRGPEHLRVPLDEVGSRAFLLADGTRTAEALARDLVQEFGDRAGPADRAMAFVATMARNGLLALAVQPTPAPEPPNRAVRSVACPACSRAFHVAEDPGTRLRCPACAARFAAG